MSTRPRRYKGVFLLFPWHFRYNYEKYFYVFLTDPSCRTTRPAGLSPFTRLPEGAPRYSAGSLRNCGKRYGNLTIIDLMLYAGLRVSEVSDLKLDDIKINGSIEVIIREGKHGKYATVILIEKHSKNLRKWLKYRQNMDKYDDSEYLFVSERSGKFTARGIQMMIDKYAKLAGMEQVTCHRFRHSFCKNLADAGVNIQTIADLARHESVDTTRIYVENSREERIRALEKI